MRTIAAATIGAILTTPLTLALATSAAADTTPCPPTIVIGVDGTGNTHQPNSLIVQQAQPWIDNGAKLVRINYPASIWPLGPYPYDQSRRIGIENTKHAIRDTQQQCPHSHIHGEGFSQGAGVLGDALEELAAEGTDTSRISADLYADPRHPRTGVETVIPTGLPGYSSKGERRSMGGAKVFHRCIEGDIVCDFPEALQDPWAIMDAAVDLGRRHNQHPVDTAVVREGVELVSHEPAISWLPPKSGRTIPAPALESVWPVGRYAPIPVADYVPDVLEMFVPSEFLRFVPPPAPTLPDLPPLPTLPGL